MSPLITSIREQLQLLPADVAPALGVFFSANGYDTWEAIPTPLLERTLDYLTYVVWSQTSPQPYTEPVTPAEHAQSHSSPDVHHHSPAGEYHPHW